MKIGIENLNIYGCSMALDQRKLAEARGKDPQKVVRDFLIDTRSLNPLWEDVVTMGANAAKPIVENIDTESIGMLIVGTESSVDFGKPISTNIAGALDLAPNTRNYETKHACYSGIAAMDAAVNWLASGFNDGRKALVISSDFSREHLRTKEEFVLGGAAAAVLLSDAPRLLEFEPGRKGTWTADIYDTFRPSATAEVGNNEVSLYAYMDALEGAWGDYVRRTKGETDFDRDHRWFCYHTPFPGIAFQAHRTLCNINAPRRKAEVIEDFERRVIPTLQFSRRLGSTYGSSNLVGIAALLSGDSELRAGDRMGFYAYGSGAIGEFWSARLCDGARAEMRRMNIQDSLDARRSASVEEYERIETSRNQAVELSDFNPDRGFPEGLWESAYRGRGLLTLEKVENYVRTYSWS